MPTPTQPPTQPDPVDSESTPIRFPDYGNGTEKMATTTTKSAHVDGIQHSYGLPGDTKSRGSTLPILETPYSLVPIRRHVPINRHASRDSTSHLQLTDTRNRC